MVDIICCLFLLSSPILEGSARHDTDEEEDGTATEVENITYGISILQVDLKEPVCFPTIKTQVLVLLHFETSFKNIFEGLLRLHTYVTSPVKYFNTLSIWPCSQTWTFEHWNSLEWFVQVLLI